jgi:hypothetical protein
VKTGYLRDEPDARDYSATDLFASSSPLPDSVSLRGHVGEVLRQSNSDCVANAIAKALQVLWSIQGGDSPLVSRRALYREARAYHGAEDVDAGTRPRLAFKALRTYGFAREASWPYEKGVNDKPSVSLYRDSLATSDWVEYARCSDDPDQRRQDIKAALAALKPVCIGIQVDAAFMADPGPFWRYRGPSVGAHYVCAVGYDATGLLIVNSWGTGWGDAGFCTIAWDSALALLITSDCYVIDTAPKPLDLSNALPHPLPCPRGLLRAFDPRRRLRCGLRAPARPRLRPGKAHTERRDVRGVVLALRRDTDGCGPRVPPARDV